MAQPAYNTYSPMICTCTPHQTYHPQTQTQTQTNPPPPPYTYPYSYPTLSAHFTGPQAQPHTYIPLPYFSSHPCPRTDQSFPACNPINSRGHHVGAEPGYDNYFFFPCSHAKVIVLKLPLPPWIYSPGPHVQVPFYACRVPGNLTVGEVLVGFGATVTSQLNFTNRNRNRNPNRTQARLHVIYPQGGGRWGHMEEVRGDDEVMCGKSVKEMGWCGVEDGEQAEGEGVVYLWVQK